MTSAIIIDTLIDPQPVIRGSYVKAGREWNISSMDDIDRIMARYVPWVTLYAPSEEADLVKILGLWYWREKR